MKKIFLVLSFLLISSAAQTQVHPCDVIPPNNPTIVGQAKVGFCWSGKNSDGNTVTPLVFKVYIGSNINPAFNALLIAVGVANSAGLKYYETPALSFPAGSTSVRVTVVVGIDEVSAIPYPFTSSAAIVEIDRKSVV